jgi:pimeloyl-ACP methyl ester carboxylesterase
MATHSLADLTHREIDTNGVTLHAVVGGPTDGDPLVLLHGFPEFWYGWRNQIPALTEAGYRVIVPDQRGYNLSDKPAGIDAYRLESLAADAVGILDSLGYDSARFVGHDWGAAVLWQTLLEHPEAVDRAVTMNIPHPAVFDEYLKKPRQTLRSSYMFAFQIPYLSEFVLKAGNCWGFQQFLGTTNSDEAFTDADLDRYREAWTRPGAATGMLNYYRALIRRDPGGVPTMTVEPPTLVLWGTQDPLLHHEMAEKSADFCANGRLEAVDEATHWIQHEVPDLVNDHLLDFLDDA